MAWKFDKITTRVRSTNSTRPGVTKRPGKTADATRSSRPKHDVEIGLSLSWASRSRRMLHKTSKSLAESNAGELCLNPSCFCKSVTKGKMDEGSVRPSINLRGPLDVSRPSDWYLRASNSATLPRALLSPAPLLPGPASCLWFPELRQE